MQINNVIYFLRVIKLSPWFRMTIESWN